MVGTEGGGGWQAEWEECFLWLCLALPPLLCHHSIPTSLSSSTNHQLGQRVVWSVLIFTVTTPGMVTMMGSPTPPSYPSVWSCVVELPTTSPLPLSPPPSPSLQPLLFNTLQVRSALGSAHRRKLSFKNVSNVVVQLLHSIKYSMEVPFSNMAIPPQDKSTSITKKVRHVMRFFFSLSLSLFFRWFIWFIKKNLWLLLLHSNISYQSFIENQNLASSFRQECRLMYCSVGWFLCKGIDVLSQI